MRILPPELKPPKEPTTRRHSPRTATGRRGYQNFLSCLRWDFGFTCPFCLLHELDYSLKIGAAGSRQMSIEHHVPQSAQSAKRNKYSNCLYACMLCNRARSNKPVIDRSGRRLLNPSESAWEDHFVWDECRIRPRKGDVDALYTHETYDIDAPDKVERRRFRRDFYMDRLPLFSRATEDKIERLLAMASQCLDTDRDLFYLLIDAFIELRKTREKARKELSWYPAIPPDAPSLCRCENTENHSLPPELARQMVELP